MGQIKLVLTVWVAFVTVVVADVPGGYYQTKYDSLDVEDVLNHKRLVHHYAACLLNRGPCPPQGADLKRILPESIETTCLRCTEKQKIVIIKTIRRLRTEYPSLWKELVDYYDPTEEGIRRIEFSIDKELYGGNDDQSNFIGNRFGDSDSENGLAAPINPDPTPVLSSATTTTTRPSTASVKPGPTYLPPSSSMATNPSSTYPPASTTILTGGSTGKPLSFLPSNNNEIVVNATTTSTTTRPTTTTQRLTTVTNRWSSTGPAYGWRPGSQAFNIPVVKVDAGIRFLGSVLQTGTEVAGMLLSTVQQLFGPQRVN